MSQVITFQRRMPLRHEVDVFVAGGGPAGCAAAVTAAQAGASVFLAEGQVCFGGAGTAGMVPAFMSFGDGVNFLAGGFGETLLDRLIAVGGAGELPETFDKTGGCAIEAEQLKRVYDDLVCEAGVQFTFATQMVAVEVEGGHIQDSSLCAPRSTSTLRATATSAPGLARPLKKGMPKAT